MRADHASLTEVVCSIVKRSPSIVPGSHSESRELGGTARPSPAIGERARKDGGTGVETPVATRNVVWERNPCVHSRYFRAFVVL